MGSEIHDGAPHHLYSLVREGRVIAPPFGFGRSVAPLVMMPEKTLFQKIADREIPSDMVYEDDDCIAFRDIQPQAPVHILVVPRKPIASLEDLTEEDTRLVGHLVVCATRIAAREGLSEGYRTVFNCGRHGQQTVPHLHLHLMGGRQLRWPPG
jgi:histidine triad (HIT) family protein